MEHKSCGFERLPGTAAPAGRPAYQAEGASALAVLPRVGLIRNPRSHRNKGTPPIGIADPNLLIAAPRSKPELAEALLRFKREKIGLLAIDGGDGTIRDVLTRAAPVFGDDWPAIMILPKGKTNALAVDLGIPGRWSLTDALNAAVKGETVIRRPIVVERLDAAQRDRLGFILGAGVFNALISAGQVAHRAGAFQSFAVGVTGVFGVSKALFGIGQGIWRTLSPMHVRREGETRELERSGHGVPGTRYFVCLTPFSRFPLGLKPFPGKPDPDRINFLAMDAPLRRAVALLPAAMFGSDAAIYERLGIHRGSAPGFEIDLDGNLILDGETYPGGRYRIRRGPELRFVVP